MPTTTRTPAHDELPDRKVPKRKTRASTARKPRTTSNTTIRTTTHMPHTTSRSRAGTTSNTTSSTTSSTTSRKPRTTSRSKRAKGEVISKSLSKSTPPANPQGPPVPTRMVPNLPVCRSNLSDPGLSPGQTDDRPFTVQQLNSTVSSVSPALQQLNSTVYGEFPDRTEYIKALLAANPAPGTTTGIKPYTDYWSPQPGPQLRAFTCPADETFIGGTRGGGKSFTTIGRHVKGALQYAAHWNGLILRCKYKDFREMRRQWDELIRDKELPAIRVGGEEQPNYIRFANGALVSMIAVNHISQVDDFIGQAYTEISIEEAPEFPFLPQMIDKLKGSLRSAHGVPCRMFFSGNPGGPAASIIKAMFIPITEQGGNPMPPERVWTLADGTTRVFVRSTYMDNRILMNADPGYEQRLGAIKDENLRAAWRDGRWDVFIGQAFNFNHRHILNKAQQTWPIPEYALLYMTFDWGFGAPFSVGWWWVDSEDRIYRFAEWYGTNPEKPGIGLRITDPRIAAGIIEREIKMGLAGRPIRRLGGHDCFARKPDYKGGGQGPSTAEVFADTGKACPTGPYDLTLFRGDVDRLIKIQQFRNRLDLPDDPNEMPMLMVYDSCPHFVRTIPALSMDEDKREYLADGQEDHQFDDACHVCMDRPYGVSPDEFMKRKSKVAEQEKLQKLDTVSRQATKEFDAMIARITGDDDLDLLFTEGGIDIW